MIVPAMVEQQQAEPALGSTLVAIDSGLDFVADEEAHHKGEAIPAEAVVTNVEKHRVGVPDDEI